MPLVSAASSSTVRETFGATAYKYVPSGTSGQTVVVHTVDSDGKEVCNYSVLYDSSKHCALWIAYTMDSDHYVQSGNRTEDYTFDPAVPQSAQPTLSSSYGEYTRGHLLASSSRYFTKAANQQTFYYTNIAPQSTGFNGGGAWSKLENREHGKTLTLASNQKLFVVTGCVFRSGYTTTTCKTDGKTVAVPTDFYKCYMLCTVGSDGKVTSAKGGAYLISHTSYSGEPASYATSIDAIESMTGFDFFVNIAADIDTASAESSTSSLL